MASIPLQENLAAKPSRHFCGVQSPPRWNTAAIYDQAIIVHSNLGEVMKANTIFRTITGVIEETVSSRTRSPTTRLLDVLGHFL